MSVTTIPDSPYKGLASFTDSAEDAALFFGRHSERETIVTNLLANKLTVLYGPSGVGKSSLLRAGVAQRLRQLEGAVVVAYDAWTDDPVAGLTAAVADLAPDIGPTAGLSDVIAAAAGGGREVFLLLDQFEEYFLYHGANGPLSEALPELLRRPGLRLSVLLALRDDALVELDHFTDRLPGLFNNLLKLDRLDRAAAREAIVGPLEQYSQLSGVEYQAEPTLIEALLDEVAIGKVDFSGVVESGQPSEQIEAPFLQLVLERLWTEERVMDSTTLRLETLRRLGGAEPIVREHVQGAFARLPAHQQGEAARVVRQLVTSSGTKIAYSAADLAEYAAVEDGELHELLETLLRERIVRGVDGTPGGPPRYEIFHDILAAPILAWRVSYELEREKLLARRQRRRSRAIVTAAFIALLIVAGIAIYAFLQRSDARTQATRAHGRELAADALAGIPTDPASSVALALQAAKLAPGSQTENVLRSSLLALREQRLISVGAAVVGASFAPNGDRLLVASSDGRVGLYDTEGRLLLALPKQQPLTHIAWSAGGQLFALGSAKGTVTLWKSGQRQPLRTIQTPAPITALTFSGSTLLAASGGHLWLLASANSPLRRVRVAGAVTTAALSPNGQLVAFASALKTKITVKLYDLRTHRVRYTLLERGIDSIIFSSNGHLLVTGSTDKTARIWRVANGHLIHKLQMRGRVLSERFSDDGKWLVTASTDGTAAIWNVRSGQRNLLLVGASGAAEDAAFSPNGQEVAVAFADRTARIYSTQDGHLLAPLAGHRDAVTSIGFDPSGQLIVTGSDDGTARLWRANPTGELTTIEQKKIPVTAAFAGATVIAAAGSEADLLTTSGHLLGRLRMPTRITAVASDDHSVALADSRGDLDFGSLGSPMRRVIGLNIDALAFAPSGQLVAGSRDGTTSIWTSLAGLAVVVHVGKPVVEVATANGRFAVRTSTGHIRVYSLSGEALSSINGRAQRIALSPDGKTLATTHAREADLWNASTGALLHRLIGHHSLLTDAQFSPDGRLLVTASDDHDGRLWDVATGQLFDVLRGHFFPVRSAIFSPTGRWIVTASQFSGGLWDATTGQLLTFLEGHSGPLTSASFSSNGEWIVTGSDDGTASVFRCDVCRNLAGLVDVARQRLAQVRR